MQTFLAMLTIINTVILIWIVWGMLSSPSNAVFEKRMEDRLVWYWNGIEALRDKVGIEPSEFYDDCDTGRKRSRYVRHLIVNGIKCDNSSDEPRQDIEE